MADGPLQTNVMRLELTTTSNTINDSPTLTRERMVRLNGDNNVDKNKKDDHGRQHHEHLREIQWTMATICSVWLFTWTAFCGLEYLVIAMDNDTSDATLSAIYGVSSISFILAPYVTNKLGYKHSLVLSWFCLIVFAAANYKPKGSILIPAGVLEGFGFGLMWTAQGVYVTNEAVRYTDLTGLPLDKSLNLMWGVFTMVLESTMIWQNLVTPAVLDTLTYDKSAPTHWYTCGFDVCPDDMTAAAPPTPPPVTSIGSNMTVATTTTTVLDIATNSSTNLTVVVPMEHHVTPKERTLISVYLASIVLGLVITLVFLRRLQTPQSKGDNPQPSTKELLLSVLKMQTINVDMILLLPLAAYIGIEKTVILGEFAKYFVICELGFGWYVFPLICFGASGIIFSCLSCSILGKYTSRPVQFMIAAILNMAMLVVLFAWTPKSSQKIVFFFVPLVWGISEGIWLTQTSVLVGSLFSDQQTAAFATLRMLQTTGQTFAYKYVKDACVDSMLYAYVICLVVSMVTTSVMEVRLSRRQEAAKHYEELRD